jgi:hypothetical protein
MARKRIILIETDQSWAQTQSSLPGAEEVDIVVRAPDQAEGRELAHAARLCRCRRVCVALVEQ